MAKLDLPLSLLDRLLQSRIVPLQAKIEAVTRWQDELTEAASVDPLAIQLEQRLASAYASLRQARAAKVADHLRSGGAFTGGVARRMPQLAARRATG
jgi:hypothetical protein